jgi:hypothetical protein
VRTSAKYIKYEKRKKEIKAIAAITREEGGKSQQQLNEKANNRG